MDDINIQAFTEKAVRNTKNLIKQFQGQETLPMHEQTAQNIRGSLKMEVAKKGSVEKHTEKEEHKLEEILDNPEYDNGI